jgi:formyltetrahydrofolate hydrolase
VYDETARLKKQSLALVDKAVEPYAKQEAKVEALKLDLSALVQQEQARKRNAAKVKQWQLLLNEQGHLLGGFLVKWQKDTVLNEVFVRLAESQIEQAFEVIQATEKDRR